jgi:hypothetical protein
MVTAMASAAETIATEVEATGSDEEKAYIAEVKAAVETMTVEVAIDEFAYSSMAENLNTYGVGDDLGAGNCAAQIGFIGVGLAILVAIMA